MKNVTKTLQVLMVLLLLAFASQSKAQVTLFTEGWESAAVGAVPPAGWAIDLLGYTNYLSWVNTGTLPTCSNYEGSRICKWDSWDAYSPLYNRLRMTTPISTLGYSNITVDFAMYMQNTFGAGDGMKVQWSTNGSTWTDAGAYFYNYNATAGWAVWTQALPAGAANQATLYIAYYFTTNYGYNVFTDLTHIKGLMTGNLTGTIRDAITTNTLSGVAVSCGGVGPVLTNGVGVYTLNAIPAGNQTLTATLATYTPYSAVVNVVGNTTTTYSFNMFPIPSVLSGTITNCASLQAINGAKIIINAPPPPTPPLTYSTAGGVYSANNYKNGAWTVTITKAGYSDTTTAPLNFTSGVTTTLNLCMKEATNPASQPFTAVLNGAGNAVNLNWAVPKGYYELIYDDGIQEISTVWATADNMNAVKFTPLAYPVTLISASVNIGKLTDYPNGTTIGTLHSFEVQAYDASGPGGKPGVALGHAVTVTPTSFGWNTFTLTDNISITSGNYYIVMTQKGVPPVACRLGIDTSSASQMRSFAKFGTGGWLPGTGNFMIRSVVYGIGGPTDNQAGVIGYQIYRLYTEQQGANPNTWTQLAAPATTNYIDGVWLSLPDSSYTWAVKAHYTNNRWSTYIFSNALGRNHTANVTVNVILSCDSMPKQGSLVTLTCTTPYSPHTYTGLTDLTGHINFPAVEKGVYTLTVNRFAFTTYTATNVSIFHDRTIDVNLAFAKPRPTNMTADGRSLLCTWWPPKMEIPILFDNFSSGSFATNGWTAEASNWLVYGGFGNPLPCARFDWLPEVVNYDISLISKNVTGLGSSNMVLKYDMFCYMFSGSATLTMDVDINDGTGWVTLKQYTGASSFPWTSEVLDISAYANKTFQIRFRSQGDDTFWLWDWDVDNVGIYAVQSITSCLLGYNVYLNGVHDGTPIPPTDTTYYIPGSHIIYGNTYTACVDAIYGAGTSAQTCATPFTARWLCPPANLTGVPYDNTAYLTWTKPYCGGCTLASYIYDVVFTSALSINVGFNIQMGNYFPLAATATGVIKSLDMYFVQYGTSTTQASTIYFYDAAHNLIGSTPFTCGPAPTYPAGVWQNVPVADIPYTGPFYALMDYFVSSGGIKHYMGYDEVTPQALASGLGWANYAGVWASAASTFAYAPPFTFMQRANVCVAGKDKAETIASIDPTQLPVDNNVTPLVNVATSLAPTGNITVDPPATTSAPSAVPPLLLGYNIYRNSAPTPIAYLGNPNTLEYLDMNLEPGVYTYEVSGYYNVQPVAPGFDNSPHAGPVTVIINYGRPLPFFEPWDMGTFTFNDWKHQGNWSINTGLGNPLPCADFSWQPALNNYTDTLKTPAISAAPYTCAKIYLDYDYKLIDRNATGDEYLTVEEYVGGVYKKIAEYGNNGSVNWTSQHYELKATLGKAFKIQFRANGAHSLDILHWYVDNVHIYAVCTPPTALTYTQSHNTVNLSWTAPNCVNETPFTISYDDGTYENGIANPPGYTYSFGNMFVLTPGTSGYLTSFDLFFYQNGTSGPLNLTMDVYDETYNLLGSSAPFLQGNAVWQNVEVPSIGFSGTFYGMVNENGTATRPNWLGLDLDGPQAYLDYAMYNDGAGGWGTINSIAGTGPGVYLQKANGFLYGKTDKAFTIKPGQNPYTNKPVTAAKRSDLNSTPTKVETYNHPGYGLIYPNLSSAPSLQGYNVYRTDSTAVLATFHKIGTTATTTYTDVIPLVGWGTYKYYVTSIFNDTITNSFLCESPGTDLITVQFPAVGIVEIGNGQIMVYPNPANDNVNVKSDYTINTIEVMNYVGQTVYKNTNVAGKNTHFNVSNLNAGIYFVKIATEQGARSVKITVTR